MHLVISVMSLKISLLIMHLFYETTSVHEKGVHSPLPCLISDSRLAMELKHTPIKLLDKG